MHIFQIHHSSLPVHADRCRCDCSKALLLWNWAWGWHNSFLQLDQKMCSSERWARSGVWKWCFKYSGSCSCYLSVVSALASVWLNAKMFMALSSSSLLLSLRHHRKWWHHTLRSYIHKNALCKHNRSKPATAQITGAGIICGLVWQVCLQNTKHSIRQLIPTNRYHAALIQRILHL